MLKVQAYVFSLLLMSGVALAQDNAKSPEEDPATSEQTEAQQSQSSGDGMNQEQMGKGTKQGQEGKTEQSQEEMMEQGQSGGQEQEGADQQEADQEALADQQTTGDAAPGEMFMTEQAEDQIRSDQLIGSNIVNASDEKIGSISELIMDQEGQVVGIIVGVGGFLGMGEKLVALSWDAVEITTAEGDANYQVKTSIEKEDLDKAEAYKTEEKQQSEQQLEQQQQQTQPQTQDSMAE